MLAVFYSCTLCSIGTNLLTKRLPAELERFAVAMWTGVWVFVLLIIGLRDSGAVLDISIMCGVLLFVVLLSITSSSCYIIIHNSKHWHGQLFAVSALHWVLFHDSQSWLADDAVALSIPVVTMFMCRLAFYFEHNQTPPVMEMVVWAALMCTEIACMYGTINMHMYYYICSTLYSAILGTMIGKRLLMVSFVIPLAFPLFCVRCLSNVVKHGMELGIEMIYNDLTLVLKFVSKDDLSGLLKPSMVDDL